MSLLLFPQGLNSHRAPRRPAARRPGGMRKKTLGGPPRLLPIYLPSASPHGSADVGHHAGLVDHDLVLDLELLEAGSELLRLEGLLALHQLGVHGLQQGVARGVVGAALEAAGDERPEHAKPRRRDLGLVLASGGLLASPLRGEPAPGVAWGAAGSVATHVLVDVEGTGACVRLLRRRGRDLLLARQQHEVVGLPDVLHEDLVLAQLQLGVGRGEADERLQRARGHGEPRLPRGLALGHAALKAHAQVHVALGDLRLGLGAEHRRQALAVP
mmetsp:Transcript_69417/g.203732  ORF Transcript_69417/g.203732 Transcript_69417/m.203732 type:complete len:271 (+) Transcript_69417:218-1030(+)